MYALLTLPLISALIGYITNVVAIRLLFWPQQPINFGFFKLQGVLPKRQADIAASVGELVEERLLSLDEVIDQVNTPEVRERLVVPQVYDQYFYFSSIISIYGSGGV